MLHLFIASLLWAFSFGLIKTVLGDVNPNVVAWARLAVSFVVFLPLLRPRHLVPGEGSRFLVIGAVQYGVMYLAYIQAYQFLAAHEVALFTVFTPLYVTLAHGVLARRLSRAFVLAAILAVLGGVVIAGGARHIESALAGILLMQVSNAAFAIGQIGYRHAMDHARAGASVRDQDVFALLYLGGLLAAGIPLALDTSWREAPLEPVQMTTLLYLGLIPSGIGFFLWNAGARRVNAGTLAVFNNLKIPLAVLCAIVVFGESADGLRLLAGGAAMMGAAAFAATRPTPGRPAR